MSPAQLQEMKKQLDIDIELLQKELKEVEADNEKKQEQLINEQDKLTEVRKDNGLHHQKLRKMKELLQRNENTLTESKAEFEQKQGELAISVQNFSKIASKRNEKFKMALQILSRVTIQNEDRYGNMEDYKRVMRKQIDEFKSEIALGQHEIESKRKEMALLKAKTNDEIDQPTIGPKLKRLISDDCAEALRSQRKKLVDLKMLNHNMKFKCDNEQKH